MRPLTWASCRQRALLLLHQPSGWLKVRRLGVVGASGESTDCIPRATACPVATDSSFTMHTCWVVAVCVCSTHSHTIQLLCHNNPHTQFCHVAVMLLFQLCPMCHSKTDYHACLPQACCTTCPWTPTSHCWRRLHSTALWAAPCCAQ